MCVCSPMHGANRKKLAELNMAYLIWMCLCFRRERNDDEFINSYSLCIHHCLLLHTLAANSAMPVGLCICDYIFFCFSLISDRYTGVFVCGCVCVCCHFGQWLLFCTAHNHTLYNFTMFCIILFFFSSFTSRTWVLTEGEGHKITSMQQLPPSLNT